MLSLLCLSWQWVAVENQHEWVKTKRKRKRIALCYVQLQKFSQTTQLDDRAGQSIELLLQL
jgi:hypothetical protein